MKNVVMLFAQQLFQATAVFRHAPSVARQFYKPDTYALQMLSEQTLSNLRSDQIDLQSLTIHQRKNAAQKSFYSARGPNLTKNTNPAFHHSIL